jgi:hypothetical protein
MVVAGDTPIKYTGESPASRQSCFFSSLIMLKTYQKGFNHPFLHIGSE